MPPLGTALRAPLGTAFLENCFNASLENCPVWKLLQLLHFVHFSMLLDIFWTWRNCRIAY